MEYSKAQINVRAQIQGTQQDYVSKQHATVNHTPHGQSSIACPISFATLAVTHQAFDSIKDKEQCSKHCHKRHHEKLFDACIVSKSCKTANTNTT